MKKNGNQQVLLLTAAVVPDPMFTTAHADAELRLKQYRAAIERWVAVAKDCSADVFLVETSGSGSELADLITVHEHRPSPLSISRGKGAAEFEAVGEIIRALQIPSTMTVHKATGRLFVENARSLLRPLDNSEIARVRRRLDRSYCDTRFVTFSKELWDLHLHDIDQDVRDEQGIYVEHVFAYRLIQSEFYGRSVARFAARPVFKGLSGTSGKSYDSVSRGLLSPLLDRVEALAAKASHIKHY